MRKVLIVHRVLIQFFYQINLLSCQDHQWKPIEMQDLSKPYQNTTSTDCLPEYKQQKLEEKNEIIVFF